MPASGKGKFPIDSRWLTPTLMGETLIARVIAPGTSGNASKDVWHDWVFAPTGGLPIPMRIIRRPWEPVVIEE